MMAGCDMEVRLSNIFSQITIRRAENGSQIESSDFVTPLSKRQRVHQSTRTGLSGTPLDGLNPAAKNVSERINLQ